MFRISPLPRTNSLVLVIRVCIWSVLTTRRRHADVKGRFDEEVEEYGVRILVDGKSVMHVIGTQMDFVTDRLRSEFVFTNPNSKGACGCGESFSV